MWCSSCGARGVGMASAQTKASPKPQSTDPFPFVLGLQGIRYRAERIARCERICGFSVWPRCLVLLRRKTLPGLEPARCVHCQKKKKSANKQTHEYT